MQEGDRVRDYTVHKPIGAGSGSIVYEVEDKAGVHLALKLSRVPLAATGKSPVQCERFYQSVIVHFALRDSINVVKLAEVSLLGTPQGAYPYLVMELVPRGECITAWAARTTPSLANLVEIFIDLADTLGTMADLKICHRDLKPQNILIAPEDVPKIADLNSASFPTPTRITASAASAIPGTLAYFSP